MISDVHDIVQTVLHRYHVDLSNYDPEFLHRSLQARMRETGSASIGRYVRTLETDQLEWRQLDLLLSNNHSEFFRNPLTFAVLESCVLPALQLGIPSSSRKELRVWCAGCAAGQEPYSIAMLLEERVRSSGTVPKYRIFASDNNRAQLLLAQDGEFTALPLRNLTQRRMADWFDVRAGVYAVRSVLKQRIEFSVFDLLNSGQLAPSESIFGDFDIVFCANLLIYYAPVAQLRILRRLSSSLATGGYLVVGETERSLLLTQGFHEAYPQSAIFQT